MAPTLLLDSGLSRLRRIIPKDYYPLLGDSVVYGVATALSRFFALFLTPVLTRVLGPMQFGVVDVVLATGLILQVMMSLGVETALNRYYYEAPAGQERKVLVTSILGFVIVFGGVVTGLMVALAPVLGELLFKDATYNLILAIGIIAVYLQLVGLIFQWIFRLARQRKSFLLSVGSSLVPNLVLVLVLVVWQGWGVLGYFVAALLAALFQCVVSFGLARTSLTRHFSRTALARSLRFAVPFVPVILVSALFPSIGRYILLWLGTLVEVGYFAIATKLASLVLVGFVPFQMAWHPFSMSVMHRANAKEIYANVTRYAVMLLCLMALGLICFAPELVAIIAGENYLAAVPLLPYMVLGTVAGQLGIFFYIAITIGERPILILYANLASLLLYIVLGIGMTLWLGPTGTAIAFLLSNLVESILIYWFAQRIDPIGFPFRTILLAILWSTLVAALLNNLHLSFAARLSVLLVNLLILGALFLSKDVAGYVAAKRTAASS